MQALHLLCPHLGPLAAGLLAEDCPHGGLPASLVEDGGSPRAAPSCRRRSAFWDPVSDPLLGLRVCGHPVQRSTCWNLPLEVSTAILVLVTSGRSDDGGVMRVPVGGWAQRSGGDCQGEQCVVCRLRPSAVEPCVPASGGVYLAP